jgi:hypothetical protein
MAVVKEGYYFNVCIYLNFMASSRNYKLPIFGVLGNNLKVAKHEHSSKHCCMKHFLVLFSESILRVLPVQEV